MSQALVVVSNIVDAKSIAILANYLNIIKFVFRKNKEYKKMLEHLKLLIEETLNITSARWEKQNRMRKGIKLALT